MWHLLLFQQQGVAMGCVKNWVLCIGAPRWTLWLKCLPLMCTLIPCQSTGRNVGWAWSWMKLSYKWVHAAVRSLVSELLGTVLLLCIWLPVWPRAIRSALLWEVHVADVSSNTIKTHQVLLCVCCWAYLEMIKLTKLTLLCQLCCVPNDLYGWKRNTLQTFPNNHISVRSLHRLYLNKRCSTYIISYWI